MKKSIVVLLVALMIGVWIGRASACDSYENCVEMAKANGSQAIEANRGIAIDNQSIGFALQAIAYKLDEISRKLDKCKTIQAPMLAEPEIGSEVWKANQK